MRELALTVPLSVRDAEAVSAIAVRCIRETCELDHGGRTEVLDPWVERYGANNVRAFIRERGNYGIAVTADSTTLGAAILSRAGVIRVFCVAPHLHQNGVGRRLMVALEFEARRRWMTALTVQAPATAAGFFAHMGFDAEPETLQEPAGLALTSMIKALPR